MFLVFNKEKINTYLILLSTVTFLFVMGFFISSGNTVHTAANEEKIGGNVFENENIETNIIKNNNI